MFIIMNKAVKIYTFMRQTSALSIKNFNKPRPFKHLINITAANAIRLPQFNKVAKYNHYEHPIRWEKLYAITIIAEVDT